MHTECSGGDWAPVWTDNFVWDLRHLFVGALNNRAEGSLKWNLILDENHGPALGGCLVFIAHLYSTPYSILYIN